ncbi:putative ribonuclease H-like domain-containing protein [Tanacetum coccineum]
MVPRTILTRSGPILVNAARPVNTVQSRTAVNNVGIMKNVTNNAYSSTRRPFNKITTANNSKFTKKVNIVKGTRVNTPKVVISVVKGNKGNAVKASADLSNPQQDLKDKGLIDSGCSRHMTGNRSYLTDYEEIDGGFVAFRGNSKGGKITGKGKIRTGKLDFKDVYFVKELKFNLFSVSQMCDKKNSVLFTDTECVVLSPDFKLTDESHVLLKVPRKDNMYSVDLKNVVPQGGLTCLFAKATPDESNLWHRRLGHVNFKTINKLVKGNLVRGLPSKLFKINQTCVACQKGKQHRASCKTKIVSSISQPLQMLHMDLFGPTFVKSLMKKMYCLVVTDDFSRFSWVFFLATKDETSEILKTFITGIENLIDLRVKVIRCDNGTEFKNRVMNQFCEMKGIKREFSVARTPQQNGVAERKNRTLIEAARTMLADSKLPTTFWAEAVNTACYVQNRVLVIKPHNKTPYELFLGRKPALSFMRPFGCPVTILNTIDHLGKFDGKADEGFFVGYSTNSKAFRVFNSRTRIVEENLHVQFSENTPNIAGSGPNWLFDIDALTKSMNYKPVVAGNQSNGNAGTKACDDADLKSSPDAGLKPSGDNEKKVTEEPGKEGGDSKMKQLGFLSYASLKTLWCYQYGRQVKLTFLPRTEVKRKRWDFISQDKYVTEDFEEILALGCHKQQAHHGKPIKPLLKDAYGDDLVCACARFQVNPKVSHLHAVKRIFRYLKGQPKLGLWYPKDSPFDLVAFTDSDYAGASLDRKSTTGGCQFLGCRLISWQCKKQTVVANSTTEAEYIAASNCCGQVLWIQNQMLDYGYNFMHTKIYIDNESTICIVKNPVFHSKTKHIEIRHHFIRDSNEKKLIQMIKIHTDQNVADLLTKAFDRIIHKGWLKWNVTAARDEIEVKTGNSRVNAAGHYLVLLGEKNADFAEIVDFLNANPISSKSTAWNEFGTNIASTVISLAKNQKFNFSKLIFDVKAYWALKHANFDLKTAGDHRKLQLNELSELRDQAYENSLIYKEKTKKLHDSKIKNRIFNVGDQVLLFNSRLKIFSGKLKSRWSGPFTITEVYPYGTAKLSHTDGSNFKVNCHRLKHYHGGDTPPLVIPDLQTFPKDN